MGKHSVKAKRNREKIDKKKVKKISNTKLVNDLEIYKAPLLEAIFHNAIHTKCVRSQALAIQIFDLLHIKQNETNNKQINTSFKIIANNNEKQIEGVG